MSDHSKAYFYALLTVLFWSTVATAFKWSLQYLDIWQLLFFACVSSSSVLLVPVLLQKNLLLLWQQWLAHWKLTLLIGLINPMIYYIVLFAAYDRLPAQIAQPVNYTWAIVLVLMSALFLGQKLTRFDLSATFICYAGVVIIATQGSLSWSVDVDPWGLALAMISTLIWASYWILNMQDIRDQRVAMCLNFLVALPITGVGCALFSDFQVNLTGLAGALYVGVFEMGLAFLFWSKALRLAANASRVSTLIFLSPFLSLYLIHLVLGEEIHPATLIGLTVIVAGLLLQQLPIIIWNRSQ
ncbi:MAG: DMT family transporter [Gammaproteobacteria bacterium]|nr:DMT family transporter [Gammaproteobacteria bacterium]